MYSRGLGVPQSVRVAVNWYLKAAVRGHAGAQYNLGLMYETGRGVPEDVQLYKSSAEQDYTSVQYKLGVMYAQGNGVLKNAVVAVRWYRKVALEGVV